MFQAVWRILEIRKIHFSWADYDKYENSQSGSVDLEIKIRIWIRHLKKHNSDPEPDISKIQIRIQMPKNHNLDPDRGLIRMR